MDAKHVLKHCSAKAGYDIKDLAEKSGLPYASVWRYLSDYNDADIYWGKMELMLKACGYHIEIVKNK